MTCLPLSLASVRYFCACDSEKGDLNTGIKWDDNWEEIPESGLAIKRGLCDAQAGWCLDGMFKKNLVYLVKTYTPLNSQITVSSVYSWVQGGEKVPLEYHDVHGGWLKSDADTSPWIKFDLIQAHTAVGFKIRRRGDVIGQYVTSFHVSTSGDDVTWSYIGTDVQAVYEGIYFTWWFDMEVTARYWRIEPVTWNEYAGMHADFIGYII